MPAAVRVGLVLRPTLPLMQRMFGLGIVEHTPDGGGAGDCYPGAVYKPKSRVLRIRELESGCLRTGSQDDDHV